MPAAQISQILQRASRTLMPFVGAPRLRGALAAIPPCLRPADSHFYAEWVDGRFALAGASVPLNGASPFDVPVAPDDWRRELLGFGWLRHCPAGADEAAEARVSGLVADWLARDAKQIPGAQELYVVARRVLSCLAHADVLLRTDDVAHYDAVLAALTADVRNLEKAIHAGPQGHSDCVAQVLGLVALTQAALSFENTSMLQRVEALLVVVLAERNPVWRVPDAVAELALDLETLRLLYRLSSIPAPVFLTSTLERLTRQLSGLILGDGSLARLGTPRDDTAMRSALALGMRHLAVSASAPSMIGPAGFVRLACDTVCVIADVGAKRDAPHALGLEMSSGTAPLLVHDGVPAAPGTSRAGTLTFASSGRDVATVKAARNMPSLEPAQSVATDLSGDGALSLDATHAGHVAQGFAHRRRLVLARDGTALEGIDELRPIAGGAEPESAGFALGFVLHPSMRVGFGETTNDVRLTARNGDTWRFGASGHAVFVEGAIYVDGSVTTPTMQILVLGDAAKSRTVEWSLRRVLAAVATTDAVEVSKPRSLAEALAAVAPVEASE
jgi:uncharacterized heparinase superfamily protein